MTTHTRTPTIPTNDVTNPPAIPPLSQQQAGWKTRSTRDDELEQLRAAYAEALGASGGDQQRRGAPEAIEQDSDATAEAAPGSGPLTTAEAILFEECAGVTVSRSVGRVDVALEQGMGQSDVTADEVLAWLWIAGRRSDPQLRYDRLLEAHVHTPYEQLISDAIQVVRVLFSAEA